MPDSNMPRLPWRRTGPKEFVAYPNGPDQEGQHCSLGFSSTGPADGFPWVWTAVWRGRFASNGRAHERQGAADQATEAWWLGIEQATEEEARTADQHRRIEAALASRGRDLSSLQIAVRDYASLMAIMTECRFRWEAARHQGEDTTALDAIRSALSEEFYRRRTLGTPPI